MGSRRLRRRLPVLVSSGPSVCRWFSGWEVVEGRVVLSFSGGTAQSRFVQGRRDWRGDKSTPTEVKAAFVPSSWGKHIVSSLSERIWPARVRFLNCESRASGNIRTSSLLWVVSGSRVFRDAPTATTSSSSQPPDPQGRMTHPPQTTSFFHLPRQPRTRSTSPFRIHRSARDIFGHRNR